MNSFTTIHHGVIDVTPEEVEYAPSRLEVLDSHFQKLIQDQKIQGAGYLLSRYGKIFAHRSLGRLCYDNDLAEFKPDSLRRIYSMTKLFTAIAVMKLIEDGMLYLEQPVKTIIEEFDTPTHNKINLFHLLTHTAGIAPVPDIFPNHTPMNGSVGTLITGLGKASPDRCMRLPARRGFTVPLDMQFSAK
ncbi:MAG: serine hydrolase domain-containing protein [Bacteroidota bacterium]